MMRLILVLLMFLFGLNQAWASCNMTNPCKLKGGDAFRQPTVLTSKNGKLSVTLRAEIANLTADWLQIPRRSYNGEFPGPTLRVAKGDTLEILLINNIHHPASSNKPILNTTNIHVHGLHVSSKAPSDDVFIHVDPDGGKFIYTFHIDADHAAGTYFYHPHVHGSGTIQMADGMAGMLIVEDSDGDKTPEYLKAVSCPFHCEHDVQLTFQPTLLYSTANFVFSHGSLQKWARDGLDDLSRYEVAGGGTLLDWVEDPVNEVNYYTVNGQLLPVMKLDKGQTKRFRMLNGGPASALQIEVVDEAGNHACDYKEIAVDGLYLDEMRRPKMNKSLLLSGNRVDWLISCNIVGNYTVRSLHDARDEASLSNDSFIYFNNSLFTIVVNGNATPVISLDTSAPLPLRPSYVSDFRQVSDDEVKGRFVVEMGPFFDMNRELFTTNTYYRYKFKVGELQEWYIVNTGHLIPHIFHMHVHHFQIISYEPFNGPYSIFRHDDVSVWKMISKDYETCHFQHKNYNESAAIPLPGDFTAVNHHDLWKDSGPGTIGYYPSGEFRDVILLPPWSKIKIRFMPHKFTGRIVVHCHFVDHSDDGMMMVTEIVHADEPTVANISSGPAFPGTCLKCDKYLEKLNQKCSSSARLPVTGQVFGIVVVHALLMAFLEYN